VRAEDRKCFCRSRVEYFVRSIEFSRKEKKNQQTFYVSLFIYLFLEVGKTGILAENIFSFFPRRNNSNISRRKENSDFIVLFCFVFCISFVLFFVCLFFSYNNQYKFFF